MLKIFYYNTLGMLLLLLLPIIFFLSNWRWYPNNKILSQFKLMFLIMQTVTNPWGILISIFLTFWILWVLNFNLKSTIKYFLIIHITIFLGQYIKYYMKYKIHKPRPYIFWLEKNYGLNIQHFYKLNNIQRKKIIHDLIYNKNIALPNWLKEHWEKETDFACPSGHAILISSWTFLIISLLLIHRYYKTMIIAFLWSYIVMLSRLIFGMHWPLDLIIGIILSWFLVNIALIVTCHINFKNKII
ncbi:MAG: phosphatase PAP2 family protein [Pantoea sp. Brub]|nr:phosphatase PAP2 family protein [Pantoea sp. Brub]